MDFGKGDFEIRVANTNFIAHNIGELDNEVIVNRLLHED